MVNIIALAVIGLIVGAAAGYVYKEKKRGVRCVGCPDGGSCGGNCAGCSGCGQT
nr:FeoB-associated Cys-rich membrane protein [Oscillospiraceae bacterium]